MNLEGSGEVVVESTIANIVIDVKHAIVDVIDVI